MVRPDCSRCQGKGITDRLDFNGQRLCPSCGGRHAHPWALRLVRAAEERERGHLRRDHNARAR